MINIMKINLILIFGNMTTLDIKKVSVYDFLEIMNSKWVLNDYLDSSVEIESFSDKEEQDILNSKEFKQFQSTLNSRFLWK